MYSSQIYLDICDGKGFKFKATVMCWINNPYCGVYQSMRESTPLDLNNPRDTQNLPLLATNNPFHTVKLV